MAEIWGLMAEFKEQNSLVAAAEKARQAGYRRLDAYTPYPIEGLSESLGHPRTKLPLLVLLGGLVGAAGGFLLQCYVSALAYPLNIGGKPLVSWPAFIPVTFELTILGAAAAAVGGMLVLNDLPTYHHPVFNVAAFDEATRSGFFLTIESSDPLFRDGTTRDFLNTLGALKVFDVQP